jgi:type I restriction enzyme M protein
MKPEGRAVVLLSHGFLFRGGSDARVRENLVRGGLVQAVIGLPAKLKSGTAIETALIVFGKNTTDEIVFIDASRLQPSRRGKAELTPETIQKSIELLRSRASVPGISCVVHLKELVGSSNLLPRRYISTGAEDTPLLDLDKLQEQVRELEAKAHRTAKEMDHLLSEIKDESNYHFRSSGSSDITRAIRGVRHIHPNPFLDSK